MNIKTKVMSVFAGLTLCSSGNEVFHQVNTQFRDIGGQFATGGANTVFNVPLQVRNGFVFMQCFRLGNASFTGHRRESFFQRSGGTINSGCFLSPAGQNLRGNTWCAWWAWNGTVNPGQLLEIDVVENTPGGNQFNYYWSHDGTEATGNRFTAPNSRGWLNNVYANYLATWSFQGTSVSFQRGGFAPPNFTRGGGTARNTSVNLRLSHRPWPFNNNVNGAFLAYPNFIVYDVRTFPNF